MYKFVGKEGQFVAGVPAHDLDEDDMKTLSDEQKDILKSHLRTDQPLYERVKEEDKVDDVPKKADKKA